MGFVSKFYVLAAGAAASAWYLILILAITSTAGLFYYLRIVVALYSPPPEHVLIRTISKSGAFVVVALSILLIWFGIYPAPILNLVRETMLGRDAQSLPLVTRLNR